MGTADKAAQTQPQQDKRGRLTEKDSTFTPTAWCFLPRLQRYSSRQAKFSRWLTAASITSITCKSTEPERH